MAMQGRELTMANAIHSGNSSYELGKVSKRAFHGHYVIRQLYLSGVWLGADLRTDTKKTYFV